MLMRTVNRVYSKCLRFSFYKSLWALLFLLVLQTAHSQEICRADTSFTDILFLIDNSQSIDDLEYDEFSDIIMATINNVQSKCTSSQIGVVHYGGAFGAETVIEHPFSRFNNISGVQRQFCTVRNQFDNCQEGGGDDLNNAIGDVIGFINDGALNRNTINKLALVIFTDAFGFEDTCTFINCSLIKPFTNIDLLKSQYGAQVTVVGASSQAESTLLALYASPGGTYVEVQLSQDDCPNTYDGCTLPRKYIPVEFDSPVGPTSDSIASCVSCTVEIVAGVIADAGDDQTLCAEEDATAILSADLINGTPPFLFEWDQGIGQGNNIQVAPVSTTTYTVTITDQNGCQGIDQVTIFVEDCIPDCADPPIIACPADAYICIGGNISPDSLGMATAQSGSDVCPSVSISYQDSVETISSCIQYIHRIWTATYDDVVEGPMSSSCIQTITIEDNEAPLISGVTNDIFMGSGPDCMTMVEWPEPYITDNCGIQSITSTHSSGDLFDIGITYVVYTATDECGNMSQDSFAVNVIQECCLDGPIINCPPDYSGCPNSPTDPDITGYATASVSGPFCGSPIVTHQDEVIYSDECDGAVVIRRTWIATDTLNDLTSTCEQLLNLIDTVPPMLLSCPPDVTLDPDNAYHEWQDPQVAEDCGFRIEYSVPNGSFFETGVTTVIVSAIDLCGNIDTCSFRVNVPKEVEIFCPDTTVLRCLDELPVELIPIPETSTECELCIEDPENCVQIDYHIDTVITEGDKMYYSIAYTATDLCNTDNECTAVVVIDNSGFIDCPDDLIVQAPPHGFLNVDWEEPIFETCCSVCIPERIPGYLYMGQLGDSYYYCSFARVKWAKAKREAEEIGGYLASINSEEENNFIARRLIERNAYIGLSDYATEGQFEWHDGSPLSYLNWKSGEPNNAGNEDYVEMTTSGFWYDVDGQDKREFVVEIKGCDHVRQIDGPESGSKLRVGTSTVTYVAEDGCGNTDTCSFDIVVMPYLRPLSTTLKSAPLSKSLTISPNPVESSFVISSEKDLIHSVELYRMDGVLMSRLSNIDNFQAKIAMDEWRSGVYLTKIAFVDGSSEFRKIVKQ